MLENNLNLSSNILLQTIFYFQFNNIIDFLILFFEKDLNLHQIYPRNMREKKRVSLIKDLRLMMYGFGDAKNPRKDTTVLLHEYLIGYLKNLLIKTQNMAKLKGKTKTDDLLYILKKDRRKYMRVKDLLATNEELKNARKAFDFEEYEKE